MALGNTFDVLYRAVGAGQVTSANRAVAGSITRLNQVSRSARSGLLGMGSALTGNFMAVAAGAMAIRRSVVEYERYTESVARLNTTLAAQTVNHRQNTRLIRDLSESVGREFGYSLVQSNDSMNTLLQTGLGVHRSMRVFGTSLQLARVADMDTARATQFLTDTMNMFRVEQARGGEETQHFARRMATQLSVAANMASTDISSLQQAFRYAGGEMSSLGYSSADTMSALAALSSVGLRGTTAGTRLRGAIAALHTPTSTTMNLLRQWGVEQTQVNEILYDSQGRLRQLSGRDGAMSRLSALMDQMPSQFAQNTAVIRIFGRRSMAAGSALAGMSEAGERTERIFARLQQRDVTEGGILDEQARTRMNSFGMQMTQLREGARDLAITFGEILFSGLATSERGFGTVFREMVRGIRLAGDLTNMTADQRREWNAMSPETRAQATEFRALLDQISNIIRVLGMVAGMVLRLASYFPRLTLAVIAYRVAIGGSLMQTAIATFTAGTITASGGAAALGQSLNRVAVISRLAGFGALMGVAYVTGYLTTRLERNVAAWAGVENENRRFLASIQPTTDAIRSSIPIVGDLAAQWYAVYTAARQAREEYDIVQRRQQGIEGAMRSSAQTQMETILASRRRSTPGMTVEQDREMVARETSRAASRQLTNVAVLMHAAGARNIEQITSRLAQAGLTGEALQSQSSAILRMQQSMSREQLDAQARSQVNQTFTQALLGQRDFTGAANDATRALVQFNTMLTEASANEFGVSNVDFGGASQQSIPEAGDAYVRRSGVIRATAGDVLVNRQSLANAITAAPGGMVGPILGQGTTMAGPPGTGGGGGGGGSLPPIIIQIDGREVARAVGRQHVTHLERSGASFQPGQRRTMRETGFMERLG